VAKVNVVDDNDDDPLRLREAFCSDRVDPILRTTAEINGLEHLSLPKEVESGTLRYGSLGLRQVTEEPIMKLPVEVTSVLTDARESTRPAKPMTIVANAFRVPRKDYDELLTVPKIDDEIAELLEAFKTTKMPEYSVFWESELKNIDSYMRWFMRVAAFQMAVL
jgi:hypothetical protein